MIKIGRLVIFVVEVDVDKTSQVIKVGRNLFNPHVLKSQPPRSNMVFSNMFHYHQCGMKVKKLPTQACTALPSQIAIS
jgi:hypothetical protein